MEKLIELLNEFLKKEDKSIYTFYWNQVFNCIHRGNGERCDKEWICSKSFGFIKWLVENDKIDYHNKINYHISLAIHWREKRTTREERLLMMLAIQDEPIRFLISILKDSNNTTKGEVKIGSENQDTKKLDITTTHIEGDTYLA